jgi:glycerol uptake facilitator-like aquaporin
VLIGAASVIAASLFSNVANSDYALPFVAFAFGGTVALLILALGRYSGSLVNPAITVAVASAGLLKREMIAPYLFFQILGGVLAGAALKFFFGGLGGSASLFGATKLSQGVGPSAGMIFEASGTFILAFSSLIAIRRIKNRVNQALVVGTTLFILILLIGPLTGAGFNPARSLGPSLASGYSQDLYVYLIGPTVGGFSAGLLYRIILRDGEGRGLTPN